MLILGISKYSSKWVRISASTDCAIGFIGHLASASIAVRAVRVFHIFGGPLACHCLRSVVTREPSTNISNGPQTPMVSRAPATGNETRTAPLGLRIKPSFKAAHEELAHADHRTVASYVELVLEAHVEAKRKEGKKR